MAYPSCQQITNSISTLRDLKSDFDNAFKVKEITNLLSFKYEMDLIFENIKDLMVPEYSKFTVVDEIPLDIEDDFRLVSAGIDSDKKEGKIFVLYEKMSDDRNTRKGVTTFAVIDKETKRVLFHYDYGDKRPDEERRVKTLVDGPGTIFSIGGSLFIHSNGTERPVELAHTSNGEIVHFEVIANNEKIIFFGRDEKTLKIIDLYGPQTVEIALPDGFDKVKWFNVFENSDRLVVEASVHVYVFKLSTGELVDQHRSNTSLDNHSVSELPDGRFVFGHGKSLEVLGKSNRRGEYFEPSGEKSFITQSLLSADKKYLISTNWGKISLWNSKDMKLVREIDRRAMRIDQIHGNNILCTDSDGTMFVWNYINGTIADLPERGYGGLCRPVIEKQNIYSISAEKKSVLAWGENGT